MIYTYPDGTPCVCDDCTPPTRPTCDCENLAEEDRPHTDEDHDNQEETT